MYIICPSIDHTSHTWGDTPPQRGDTPPQQGDTPPQRGGGGGGGEHLHNKGTHLHNGGDTPPQRLYLPDPLHGDVLPPPGVRWQVVGLGLHQKDSRKPVSGDVQHQLVGPVLHPAPPVEPTEYHPGNLVLDCGGRVLE